MTPWTQPWFINVLHAEVSGLVILEADGDWEALEESVDSPAPTKREKPKDPNERPPSFSIPNVRDIFNPVQLPREEFGPGSAPYKAYPVLVGDIMPWGNIIPGTGKWYHVWDILFRKMTSKSCVHYALQEMRRAFEQVFHDEGARVIDGSSRFFHPYGG